MFPHPFTAQTPPSCSALTLHSLQNLHIPPGLNTASQQGEHRPGMKLELHASHRSPLIALPDHVNTHPLLHTVSVSFLASKGVVLAQVVEPYTSCSRGQQILPWSKLVVTCVLIMGVKYNFTHNASPVQSGFTHMPPSCGKKKPLSYHKNHIN